VCLLRFYSKYWSIHVLQVYRQLEVQHNLAENAQKQTELREAVQKVLRWAGRRNKNFEEKAAQLHMLVGWAQLAEVQNSESTILRCLTLDGLIFSLQVPNFKLRRGALSPQVALSQRFEFLSSRSQILYE
jgi:hypothetical protein